MKYFWYFNGDPSQNADYTIKQPIMVMINHKSVLIDIRTDWFVK